MTVFRTLEQVLLSQRTPVFVRVFQTLFVEGDLFWQHKNKLFIPRTSVFVRVFQTLEVTKFGSIRTSSFVPRTSVFVRVCQTLELTFWRQHNKKSTNSKEIFCSCAYFSIRGDLSSSFRTSHFILEDICFHARISNTRADLS